MLVPLTNSPKFAIVDDSFREEVECQKWWATKQNYVRATSTICFPGYRILYLHTLIMGENPGFEIDHINGDPLDNRTANLRWVNRRQQCTNRGIASNNTSGRKGVSRITYGKILTERWLAYIYLNNHRSDIGWFKTFEEACQAREKAERQLHGEYARKAG